MKKHFSKIATALSLTIALMALSLIPAVHAQDNTVPKISDPTTRQKGPSASAPWVKTHEITDMESGIGRVEVYPLANGNVEKVQYRWAAQDDTPAAKEASSLGGGKLVWAKNFPEPKPQKVYVDVYYKNAKVTMKYDIIARNCNGVWGHDGLAPKTPPEWMKVRQEPGTAPISDCGGEAFVLVNEFDARPAALASTTVLGIAASVICFGWIRRRRKKR